LAYANGNGCAALWAKKPLLLNSPVQSVRSKVSAIGLAPRRSPVSVACPLFRRLHR